MKLVFAALIALPLAGHAACPPLPDAGDATATHLTDLLTAPDQPTADAIAARLWEIWLKAPDAEAQDLLDRAISRRQIFDLALSEALLDRLIGYCPNYPEAYNQRAFTRFLAENYEGALADIDVVLETTPYHFGALSGQAMTYMRQGRPERAQAALRRAVKVHPYLRERSLIRPGPAPPREGDL
ncbi:MAG: hypothetical protein AAFY59_11880 [Pseudomonadota bacterium]